MCGISGYVSSLLKTVDLELMTNRIAHRGPDAAGHWYSPVLADGRVVGLGHRRLSILDLSSGANQPFWSADGRYVMVFNGEVYNYMDLAKAEGLSNLRTTSDTEVILELFAQYGVSVFERFNGMFALAIWDTEQHTLTFARDRMGKKPLYLYQQGKEWGFSSELKSLKAVYPNLTINNGALPTFLHYGYLPKTITFYKEVTRLLPGHYMVLKLDSSESAQQAPFWEAAKQFKTPQGRRHFNAAKASLNNLMEKSVAYRMIADVPLGTFLSGGTDSSLVTAVAQHLSDRPIQTFSIGFKEAKYNESEHAAKVAKYLKTNHHEFILSTQDAQEQVVKLTGIYDEPFGDSSAIPTLLVSRMAREHVTVALSGDGGDELFMGYGMYNWAKRLDSPLVRAFRYPIAMALRMGSNRHKRAAELFRYPSLVHLQSHIFSQEQYLYAESEINQLLVKPSAVFQPEAYTGSHHLSAAEAQAFFDLTHYLPDDLLVKVDRASMQHSLEVRCPLLDADLVSFALNVPEEFKVSNKGTTKHILKEVMYDYLPKELMARPKWGFSIPLGDWLKTDLQFLIQDYLNKEVIERVGAVHYNKVQQYIKRFLGGEDYLYNRIWHLIVWHKAVVESYEL